MFDGLGSMLGLGGGEQKSGQGSSPDYGAGRTGQAGAGTTEQRAMLDTISMAEGTPSYGTIYGGAVVPELEKGELTIDEVLEMQRTGMVRGRNVGYKQDGYDSDATGRYQFMSYVLREEMQKQGISGDTLFTPELQDKMILERIRRMRGVTPELLAKEGMSDKVIDMLAPEFASFPNLMGDRRYGYGTSYYGQGGKSASTIKDTFNRSLQRQVQPAPAPQSQSARDAFIPPPRKKASNMIMPGAMNIASAPRRPRLDIAPENVSAETGNPSYTHHSSTYYDPSTLSSLVAVG
jgi:hypothetical protein